MYILVFILSGVFWFYIQYEIGENQKDWHSKLYTGNYATTLEEVCNTSKYNPNIMMLYTDTFYNPE